MGQKSKIMVQYNNLKITMVCLAIVFNSCGQNDEGVMINGVKWATCNVDVPGTFAANPEDAGMFYQWNRKTAWNAKDSTVINWDDTNAEGDIWEKANDPSPTGWRLPSNDDIEKLLDTIKVSNEWIILNGVNGIKFTDKATGKSIFLPVIGFRSIYGGTLREVGLYSYYWSSTPHDSDNDRANRLVLCINYVNLAQNTYRKQGFSIRCVADRAIQ